MTDVILPPSSSNNERHLDQSNSLAQYGLVSDPFADYSIPTVAADDSYASGFFMGAERRAVLDEVIHLCQFGNNLVALLGETGVGKTAFVHQAVLELHETARCGLVNASSMATMSEIFGQVARCLDIELSSSATAGEMLAAIRQYVPAGGHQRIVVIIDDAHYLDDQILAAIVSLLQGQQSYHLHVLLAGDDSLASRLDKFEMVDVLIYDIALRSLTLDELEEYLQFKLDLAGYQGERLFDPAAVESLWRDTSGLPAAINVAARNVLLNRHQPASEPSFSLPIWHMVIVGILLVALIMALFYMGDDTKDVTAENSISESPIVEAPVVEAPVEGPVVGDLPAPSVIVEAPSSDPAITNTISGDVVTAPLEGGSALAAADNIGEGNLPAAPAVVRAPATKVDDQVTKPLVLQQPSEADVNTKKKPEISNRSKLTDDERQVIAWPESSYTLQVMAAGQLKGVRAFVEKQPNSGDLRIVRVLRQQKPWYIVLVGVYANSLEARSALQSLPQVQINAGPWPRKISDIQLKIRDFSRK